MFILYKIKLSNTPHNKIGKWKKKSGTMRAEPHIQMFKCLHVQNMAHK